MNQPYEPGPHQPRQHAAPPSSGQPHGRWPPPGDPYGPYYAERPQKPPDRKWPWILGIVAALFVGMGIGGAATTPPAPVAAPSQGEAKQASGGSVFSDGPYRLEAVSEAGARVQVIYNNGTGGMDQDTVNSGWTLDIPEGTRYGSGSFSVTTSADWAINNRDTSDTLTCRIYEGDELTIEQSGTGQHASATCSGY